jgi:hypothetical protein
MATSIPMTNGDNAGVATGVASGTVSSSRARPPPGSPACRCRTPPTAPAAASCRASSRCCCWRPEAHQPAEPQEPPWNCVPPC